MFKNIIKKTPLEYNYRLSTLFNSQIYFKREDLQTVRSFKIRGAFNAIHKYVNQTKEISSITTASAGNHAQGVAHSCHTLKIPCDIFVPYSTPRQKVDRIKYFGKEYCTVHKFGESFDECLEKALHQSYQYASKFIHPFDDKDVIEGQSTVGKEILEEMKPDYIVGCIGGGGLMSGIQKVINENNMNSSSIGVESYGADAMNQSIKNNKIVRIKDLNTFADGAAVHEVGRKTFMLCKQLEDIITIKNNELCHEMVNLYQNEGIIVEPAGALSVAGLKHISDKIENKTVVCIISGGNNDIMRYNEIIEKSLIYQNVKHYFIIDIVQKPGQLKEFVLNVMPKNCDITRFEYIKKSNKPSGSVLIGFELDHPNSLELLILGLQKSRFTFKRIDESDILYSYLI